MSKYDMLTYLGFSPYICEFELSYCISNLTEIRTQKDRFKSYAAFKTLKNSAIEWHSNTL